MATRPAKGKPVAAKAGRPTKYKKEYDEQVRKLCLLGATDEAIADFFGVSVKTLIEWRKVHPSFLQSTTQGKMLADADVAEKLYDRACGYSHEAVKIFNQQGVEMVVPYTEHYPPDTQAASLWLRNRQPKLWRDKPEDATTGVDMAQVLSKLIDKLPE